jgi:hypothetical protein
MTGGRGHYLDRQALSVSLRHLRYVTAFRDEQREGPLSGSWVLADRCATGVGEVPDFVGLDDADVSAFDDALEGLRNVESLRGGQAEGAKLALDHPVDDDLGAKLRVSCEGLNLAFVSFDGLEALELSCGDFHFPGLSSLVFVLISKAYSPSVEPARG